MKIWQAYLTKELIEELMPLIKSHKEEVATFPDIPLSVDWGKYLAMQEADQLKIFIVRNDKNELVGYMSCIVAPALHYSTSLQCFVDAVFLAPNARGNGIRLFKYMETIMEVNKIEVIQFHVKVQHDFSNALEKLGYVHVEKIMAKRLM